jgi:membrane protease YdiL (CAAX protease family)
MPLPPVLDKVRETTWIVLALAAVAQVGANLFVNAVLFQDPAARALDAIHRATGGLVQATLVASLFNLTVVGLVIFGVGRLRGADVGWRPRAILPGFLITLGFWAALHVGLAVALTIDQGEYRWHSAWTQPGPSVVLGWLLAQLLGNALAEETMFRGFLLPQLYLKTSRHCRRGVALTLALLGSQLFFALCHLPNRIFEQGRAGPDLFWDQLWLVGYGLLYAAVYLLTRTLFAAVGVHALANTPTPLVQAPGGMISHVWQALSLLLVIAGLLARKRRARGQRTIEMTKVGQAPA